MFKFCYMSLLCALINPLNTELNPICHLLPLLGAHFILHVSEIRVKDTITNYVILLHKHYKSLTITTITRRTQCFLKTKHFCYVVHIFACMSYFICYTTLLKKNNTCEITHFYHSLVKVFALLGCCGIGW